MSLLEVRQVTHHFAGLRAVSDLNLCLEPGELVALIGPNGAGKTTAFNLITGVYKPSEGSIVFAGEEISGLRTHQIVQRGIARTFQNIRLFPDLSVLDNLRIAQYSQRPYSVLAGGLRLPSFRRQEALIRERSRQLLAAFKLEGQAEATARNLPYGQQRRLEIARALATNPRLLLLDEPAAGMNPQEAEELRHLILWVHREFDLTILLIEHQMRVVMGTAQRIIVLDFGETIAEGTPAEIQANARVIEAYLGEAEEAV